MSMYMYSGVTLPPQMIPLAEKDSEWEKDNMDSLESIARAQYNSNISLIENYEMIRGRFIFSHYYKSEGGHAGMLEQLTREFELPTTLRHYDIISPVINTLIGEWSKRPDSFRVKDWSDSGTNEYIRKKTELLASYVQEIINIEIEKAILEAGLADVQPQSEEEANQIKEQIDQIRSSMTPPEIESYIKTSFRTAAEMWGQNRIEADKQKFNLREKERTELEDMFCADRCFRHFYLTATGYSQETWNPIHTFYHKSPDVEYIEDGEYVGRIFHLTLPDIIDRYGYLMTKDNLESLVTKCKRENKRWNEAKGTGYVHEDHVVPFKGYEGYSIARGVNDFFGENQHNIPFIDSSALATLTSGGIFNHRNGYYEVTEAYWKSYEKLHLITYMDEDGIIIKKIVDEHFVIPKGFKESKKVFSDDHDLNTYVSTYVTRVYKGIKINMGDRDNSLYLDVKPLEFQFKGDSNIYGAKLPVCGQIFSVRNSKSMSLVDMMKPHQIGHNVAMNQLYQIMEKEVGAFLVFDVNMFLNSKDWGGEDTIQKSMLAAKALGMLPIDTSPSNVKAAAAASGGQFPKILDLNLGAQMVSRMNIAKFFKDSALEQVGFNQYRLGSYTSSATAAGVEQGASQSYAQTDTYFTKFSNYLRRCYRMNLDIAQFVQSQERDIVISYVNSDLSQSTIKILGTDLLLSDLYIFVSDSQEMLRQLETLRQLGLNNNTSGATIADLAEVVTSNSPQHIKKILKESVEKANEQADKNREAQLQEIEAEKEITALKEQKLDERLDKEIAKDIEIATINANSKIFFNRNYEPSESDIASANQAIDDANLNREKFEKDSELKSQKINNDASFQREKLALENKKVDAKIQKEKDDIKYAQIMKGQKKQ